MTFPAFRRQPPVAAPRRCLLWLVRGALPDPPSAGTVWPSLMTSGLSATTGRIAFVLLRTTGLSPVALHPASRRRSYLRLPGASFSREGTSTPPITPACRRTSPWRLARGLRARDARGYAGEVVAPRINGSFRSSGSIAPAATGEAHMPCAAQNRLSSAPSGPVRAASSVWSRKGVTNS